MNDKILALKEGIRGWGREGGGGGEQRWIQCREDERGGEEEEEAWGLAEAVREMDTCQGNV